jgi:phospholipase/carboxylesterase
MRKVLWKYAILISIAIIVPGILWWPWLTRLSVIREGGKGPPTLVLLHGYASSAEHWIPYSQSIALPPNGRFLFPQAPETTQRTDGGTDGRAWWELDLESHLRQGKDGIDLTREDPEGLKQAARKVRSFLSIEGNSKSRPFILGGFSQGAMVACQIAFLSDEPMRALVVLSGTPVNEKEWRTAMGRRKGLPVFMSHGTKDTILPFKLAERLKAEMIAAGMSVTFARFEGSHEIPAEVVIAMNDFLAKINYGPAQRQIGSQTRVGAPGRLSTAKLGTLPLRISQ